MEFRTSNRYSKRPWKFTTSISTDSSSITPWLWKSSKELNKSSLSKPLIWKLWRSCGFVHGWCSLDVNSSKAFPKMSSVISEAEVAENVFLIFNSNLQVGVLGKSTAKVNQAFNLCFSLSRWYSDLKRTESPFLPPGDSWLPPRAPSHGYCWHSTPPKSPNFLVNQLVIHFFFDILSVFSCFFSWIPVFLWNMSTYEAKG